MLALVGSSDLFNVLLEGLNVHDEDLDGVRRCKLADALQAAWSRRQSASKGGFQWYMPVKMVAEQSDAGEHTLANRDAGNN